MILRHSPSGKHVGCVARPCPVPGPALTLHGTCGARWWRRRRRRCLGAKSKDHGVMVPEPRQSVSHAKKAALWQTGHGPGVLYRERERERGRTCCPSSGCSVTYQETQLSWHSRHKYQSHPRQSNTGVPRGMSYPHPSHTPGTGVTRGLSLWCAGHCKTGSSQARSHGCSRWARSRTSPSVSGCRSWPPRSSAGRTWRTAQSAWHPGGTEDPDPSPPRALPPVPFAFGSSRGGGCFPGETGKPRGNHGKTTGNHGKTAKRGETSGKTLKTKTNQNQNQPNKQNKPSLPDGAWRAWSDQSAGRAAKDHGPPR